VLAGGGVYNDESTTTTTNCVFLNNHADLGGGGMANSDSESTVINCTFADNESPMGGGITNNLTDIEIINTILWGNTGDQVQYLYGSLTVSYSNIQGGGFDGVSGNIDMDPLFVDAEDGDLRLTCGAPAWCSPCVDTATDTAPVVDFNGKGRVDIPGVGVKFVDMGAFEYHI
jgi:hypothetical protein